MKRLKEALYGRLRELDMSPTPLLVIRLLDVPCDHASSNLRIIDAFALSGLAASRTIHQKWQSHVSNISETILKVIKTY